MILIVCVDDDLGMAFNHRRQSRDRIVTEKILEICGNKHLWLDTYSAALFDDVVNLRVDEKFLEKAGQGDYCFVECEDIEPYISSVEKIILFCWNRKYPSDVKFPRQLLSGDMAERKEFSGYSHDKITMEVYDR